MQNNQLPFPIDKLINNFVYTQPGNFNGQLNIPVNPMLMPYLSFIGTSCIEAIQSKANDNPLRVFLFNQMSQNAYNNQQFYSLVKLTAEYADMGLSKGTYANPNDAIIDSSIKMTELLGISNVNTYPALSSYLPMTMNQSIQNGLNILNRVAQELSQFQSSNNGFRNQQNFVNPTAQQFNQPFTPQVPQQQFNRPFVPQQQFNQPNNGMYGQQNNNQMFSNMRNSMVQQPGAPGLNGSYLVNEPLPAPVPNAVPVQPIVQPQPITPVNYSGDNECDQYGKLIKWIPCEEYPFNLAYNKHSHDLRYESKSEKVTKPFTLELTPEKLMERIKQFKARTIPDTFIPTSDKETNERKNEFIYGLNKGKISDRKKDLDIMLDKLEDTEVSKDSVVELITTKDKNSIGISDEEIWRDCDTMLKAKIVDDDKIIAYSTGAILNDPYISVEDPKPLLDKLLGCDNFIKFTSTLKDSKAIALKAENQTDAMATINYINKRITDKLNRFLNNQLALPTSIDSFIDEGVELIDYVHVKYGEKFSNEIRAEQYTIIKDSCVYAAEGFESSLSPYYAPPVLENVDIKPCITYLLTSDYFVSLNCFSVDLDFEIPEGTNSVAIFFENVPILYRLAALLYHQADNYNMKFNRCLIRTLDRKVFILTRSCIDSNTFLIGVV